MENKKSKVLKLKKKYNRLTWLKKCSFYIGAILALGGFITSGIGIVGSISAWLSIAGVVSFALGMTSMYFDADICRKINVKRDKLDEKIGKLVKEDNKERQILNEYQQVKRLERETKKQVKDKKRLIKSLIEKKNKQAKEHKKLVKILAESKKLDAKKKKLEKLEKDIEQNQNDEYVAHLLERGKETNQVKLADPIIPDEMKITR